MGRLGDRYMLQPVPEAAGKQSKGSQIVLPQEEAKPKAQVGDLIWPLLLTKLFIASTSAEAQVMVLSTE